MEKEKLLFDIALKKMSNCQDLSFLFHSLTDVKDILTMFHVLIYKLEDNLLTDLSIIEVQTNSLNMTQLRNPFKNCF